MRLLSKILGDCKLVILLGFVLALAACGLPPAATELPTPQAPVPTVRGEDTPAPPSVDTPSLQVAYIKEDNAWLWSEDGQNKPLTSAGGVVGVELSGDGQVLAFLRQNEIHLELWAVNADGSSERQLVRPEALDAINVPNPVEALLAIVPYRLEWVPGTHILAYNTRQAFDGPGLVLNDDLRLSNTETGEDLSLLPPGQGGQFYFSPDGRQVAIVTPTRIALVHADGSNRREVLEYQEVITYSEFRYYPQPQWSPDGTFLRVAIPPSLPEDPLAEAPPTELWHIPVDGTPAARLGSVNGVGYFGAGTTFSPDLERVIYTVQAGEPGQNEVELHIASSDGSGDVLFHSAPFLMFQGWGGDSQHFVFTTGERGDHWQVGQVEGGIQPLLEEGAPVLLVRWVDPQRFLALVSGQEGWELRLNSLGGATTTLAVLGENPPAYDLDFAR